MTSSDLDRSPAPAAEQAMTARRLARLHGPMAAPHQGICSWCLKLWPCPDKRWIERTLRFSRALGGAT